MNIKGIFKIVLALLMISWISPSWAITTIKWSMQGDALSLDPHALNEGPTNMVQRQIYESLVTRGVDMSLGPQLATDWEIVDPTTWNFNLRQGVKFHDGTIMTAKDVVFSFNRAQSETSDFHEYIESVESITALNDHTVQLKTSGPNPILLNQISNIFIMSVKWCAQNDSINPNAGANFASSNANGTGPFKVTLREQDTRTIMKRNKSWWGNVEHNIDRIELYPIANSATRVAALLSGEIDIVTDAPVQDLGRIASSSDHKVVSVEQMRTIFLGMDQAADELRSSNIKGKNPFKDKRVRQAFYQAIDIEAIKKKVMRDLSSPAGIITFPGVTGYTKALDERLPFDAESSKALLAEAGYPDGFDITLDCPNDRYVNDEAICTAVASMLSKVGINVTLDAQTKSKHFGDLKENLSDFYMLGWGVPILDSHYVFSFLYDSKGSWNKTNFSNARVDELIANMLVEVNLDKRNDYIAEVWAIVKDNIAYLPLHHQVISWASKMNVNVPIRPNNEPLFRFSSVQDLN